jgi:hypothetical protein
MPNRIRIRTGFFSILHSCNDSCSRVNFSFADPGTADGIWHYRFVWGDGTAHPISRQWSCTR